MKKSTAKFRVMAILLVIALLLLAPMNTYFAGQDISGLEAEMELFKCK